MVKEFSVGVKSGDLTQSQSKPFEAFFLTIPWRTISPGDPDPRAKSRQDLSLTNSASKRDGYCNFDYNLIEHDLSITLDKTSALNRKIRQLNLKIADCSSSPYIVKWILKIPW